jgi:hypothetical protein
MIPFKGSVDDVRLYSRALNNAEIQCLSNGIVEGVFAAQSQISQQLSSLVDFKDLSLLIPWGDNSIGASAFANENSLTKQCILLNQSAIENSRFDTTTGLRSFSALDYGFVAPADHENQVIEITFSAKQDSASPSRFSLILMDNYPSAAFSGADISNFTTDPYGTPALTVKLVPGQGKSIFQYSGSNGGKFDNYDYKWWLPGSVGITDGSASLIPGEGQGYPFSSWKCTERAMGDTGWANYKWLVRPDGMELYRNDTLFGTMELPKYSYTAPGYNYYESFKALRLAWQGQCYVSDVSITTMPDSLAPNRPPAISFVYPAADTTIAAGSGLYLLAEASDADGVVDRVEFYVNGQLLGTDSAAPYEYSWQSVPEGINEVTATAIDDKGAVSVAKIIKVQAETIEY